MKTTVKKEKKKEFTKQERGQINASNSLIRDVLRKTIKHLTALRHTVVNEAFGNTPCIDLDDKHYFDGELCEQITIIRDKVYEVKARFEQAADQLHESDSRILSMKPIEFHKKLQ